MGETQMLIARLNQTQVQMITGRFFGNIIYLDQNIGDVNV